ncbi:hypothetical protein [Streptomyces griseofuscus]|uniref:hypothetical protein n=1 Tax=Streptomyces griseofuscus TaxID=146922 RepID=UPI0036C5F0EE
MEKHEYTPEELAASALHQQLINLGPDTDRALMLTLRLPNGRYVGDVWLSLEDVRALTDAGMGLAMVRETTDAAAPLQLDEDEVTGQDVTNVIAGFEKLLGGE